MVEATQIFQSGLVAELVLVLRGEKPNKSAVKSAVLLQTQSSDICIRISGNSGCSEQQELDLYLSLHHGRPLCAQHFDSLEDIHRSFVAHPLQDDTQGDEDTCPPHTGTAAAGEQSALRPHPHHTYSANLFSSCNSPAVNGDWPILAKLLLGFVYLSNEIDKALPRFGHALLRPISELELTHRSRLTILQEGRKEGNAKMDEVTVLKTLLKDGLLTVLTAKTISRPSSND